MTVVTDLQQFGLSEKEAKIYITLLDLEKSVVSDIAKKSAINRSTTYILLEALRSRGFVSVSQKNNIQYWSALPPQTIVKIAEENLSNSKKKVEISKRVAKDLESKYKGVGTRPQMNLFEGREGIVEACESFSDRKQGTVYGKKTEVATYTDVFSNFNFKEQKTKDVIIVEVDKDKLVINQKDQFAYTLKNIDF